MKTAPGKPKREVLLTLSALLILSFSHCDSNPGLTTFEAAVTRANVIDAGALGVPVAKASVILNRPQIPVLCYHQIRDWRSSDSKRAKDYIVPVDNFRDQIKMLAENGYHTILPDQLYEYLSKGTSLPAKPIMITFDDSRMEQCTIGMEELKKYGFRGVFFIMTVALNKPGYMTNTEVRELAAEGNVVGSHTWDHSNVKNYDADDWIKQVDKPSSQLETITGKPVKYFAYPFGLWNKNAVEHLKERGFTAAFQLSDKRDPDDPLFTIRRMIVPGEWTTATLQKWMHQNF